MKSFKNGTAFISLILGCLAKFMNFLYVNCIHFTIPLFLDYFQILWLLSKKMFLLCFHILKYEHVGNPLNS